MLVYSLFCWLFHSQISMPALQLLLSISHCLEEGRILSRVFNEVEDAPFLRKIKLPSRCFAATGQFYFDELSPDVRLISFSRCRAGMCPLSCRAAKARCRSSLHPIIC